MATEQSGPSPLICFNLDPPGAMHIPPGRRNKVVEELQRATTEPSRYYGAYDGVVTRAGFPSIGEIAAKNLPFRRDSL